MAFSIEKVAVTAKSRALKAEYTMELAQDLKAVHGLDAEQELANILSTEILAEINREVVRQINLTATIGAQENVASAGTFNLDVDANGRWSVEKFKGLMFQLERESNAIAKATRRGKGNIMICSSDVASALQMAGVLDYTPALATTFKLTIQATHLLVFLTVVSVFTSIHTLPQLLAFITLQSATKVHQHLTLVFSTAHTFLFRWFVRLVKIHSSQKSALRHVMEWLLTHLQHLPLTVHLHLQTKTLLQKVCYRKSHVRLSRHRSVFKRGSSEPLFLCINSRSKEMYVNIRNYSRQ
jgi:uncharacterized protein with PQ loop repeat